MQINKSSWHYRFVKTFGDSHKKLSYNYSTDTCQYLKLFLDALCGAIITVLVGGGLFSILFYMMFVCPIGTVIYALVCNGTFHECLQNPPRMFIFGLTPIWIWIGASVGGLIIYLVKTSHTAWKNHKAINSDKEPGIVKVLYRSWKDKVCIEMDIV
jgi:hypothetical protein